MSLRTCKVGGPDGKEYNALFHLFGSKKTTLDDPEATEAVVTVAIVEDEETGQVRCQSPNKICFTDRERGPMNQSLASLG